MKKIIFFALLLGVLGLPFLATAASNVPQSFTCRLTFYDNEDMVSSLNYYNGEYNFYLGQYNQCLQALNLSYSDSCYTAWGLGADTYKGCIDNAVLKSPISCQQFAYYNFDKGQCDCLTGYVADGGKCVSQSAGSVLGVSYEDNNPLSLIPGWLIKNKQFVEVFYVDQALCLNWIVNEEAAARFYGSDWNDSGVIKEFSSIPSSYNFCSNIK